MTIFGTQKTSQQLHDIVFKVIVLQPARTNIPSSSQNNWAGASFAEMLRVNSPEVAAVQKLREQTFYCGVVQRTCEVGLLAALLRHVQQVAEYNTMGPCHFSC